MGSILTFINNINNNNNSNNTINHQGNPTISNESGFRMNNIRNQQQISNDNLPVNPTVTATNTTANSRLNLLAQLLNFNSSNNNNIATTNINDSSKRQQKSNTTDLINVNFSNHFYMTGKKIKNLANQAHLFLFGDQLDLSFIVSHKPVYVTIVFFFL
jgi:hypothetical protein